MNAEKFTPLSTVLRPLLALACCGACVVAAPGCTQLQLRRSTVRQATTVTELQYQQVLNNLAMLSCDPEALPSMVALKAGTTQAADTGTIGALPGALTNVLVQPALTGTRTIVEQWSTVPITDDTTLELLRKVYQNALGMNRRLSERDANDLAHALVDQIPTTADTSIEANVMGCAIAGNLQANPPLEAVLIGHEMEIHGRISKHPTNVLVDVEAGKELATVTLLDKSGAALGQPVEVRLPCATCNPFSQVVSCPNGVLEARLGSCINLTFPSDCTPTTEEGRIGCSDWRSEPYFLSVATDSGRRAAQEFYSVMHCVTNTLDWQIVESSKLHPDYFTHCKSLERVPSGLTEEIIYEINEVQEVLMSIHGGWFCVGCKADVPRCACYAGQFHDRYVWVEPGNTRELAQLTLAVLKISSMIRDRQVVNNPSGVQFSPGLTRP